MNPGKRELCVAHAVNDSGRVRVYHYISHPRCRLPAPRRTPKEPGP